jgi:hypothetical protein
VVSIARNAAASTGMPAAAVVGHQRLALVPGHELVVQVGVGVRADHRDIAAAQLGGQIGEHAHLEVTADQPAGLAAGAQDLLPLLGSEREVHRGAVLGVVEDERPAAAPVGLQEPDRVQHGPIGAGGLQLQHVQQGEQRRAVAAVEPLHQRRVVVAVVRGHHLVVGGQPAHAAGAVEGGQHQPSGSAGGRAEKDLPRAGTSPRGRPNRVAVWVPAAADPL